MKYTTKANEKENKVTFTVTVPAEEVTSAMKLAATQISNETKIPGFRPGKADYETVKNRVGEMKILEAALEGLIRENFIKAMLKEDLHTVGQPYFNVEKMAPDNDLIFTAEVALFPKVKMLADYKKLTVEKKDTAPSKEMIQKAKDDLARMQTKEIRADKGHTITKGDKAVVSLGMKKDGVVLEGGESQDHGIYTSEEHYIKGFVDEILGLKEGEKKNFTLKFPEDHYQKHLANSDIDFDVEVKEIYTLEAPEINDEFAKTVGLKDAKELDEKLHENLTKENEEEERRRQEKDVLDLLAEKSDFETIPDLLINQEIEKMVHELKHQVESQGLEFDQYLKNINKSHAELKLDFTKNALRRIEVAIILKEVAKNEGIKVEEKELNEELDKIAEQYKENKEAQKSVYSPQYREYIEHQMQNRKTIDFLKETMVK